jgi:fluoride ion exporter CrcB/FEX
MKSIYKTIVLASVALCFNACDENDGLRKPDTTFANPSTSTAKFLFINAAVDAPSLDFYVNGLPVGSSLEVGKGQNAYADAPLSITGFAANGSALANTSVRSKASGGASIGGVLKANDLIYRVGNTNTNNLVASPNARYTFIALDELDRPAPLRTFSVNSVGALVADLTYYNRITREQISKDAYNSLVKAGSDVTNFVSIGTVPAGCTDPGGIRYHVLTDTYPTDANITAAVTGKLSFVRFFHASPNVPAVYVRFVPTSTGSTISLTGSNSYVMAGQIGSFTTTSAFAATGNVASNSYTVEVHTNAGFSALALKIENVTLEPGKIYTIVARGLVGGTGVSALGAAIAQHN